MPYICDVFPELRTHSLVFSHTSHTAVSHFTALPTQHQPHLISHTSEQCSQCVSRKSYSSDFKPIRSATHLALSLTWGLSAVFLCSMNTWNSFRIVTYSFWVVEYIKGMLNCNINLMLHIYYQH